MKSSNYRPEIICVLIYAMFFSLWVISLKEGRISNTQISPLLALERLIPQHEVQLLNANFTDQLQYDQLAQLQSELETLIFEANVSDTTKQLLRDYKETSLSYTQLTSMLKTSQRLISENSRFENEQLKNVVDDILLNMFSFISTPGNADKAALIDLLDSLDITNKEQSNWQQLQLVKLHSLFILENHELAASYRKQLIGMPIIDAILQEQAQLEQLIGRTTIKKFIGIFGAILALVFLLVVVIKRNEYALRETSEQHKEFASSIMDMLGSEEVGDALERIRKPR